MKWWRNQDTIRKLLDFLYIYIKSLYSKPVKSIILAYFVHFLIYFFCLNLQNPSKISANLSTFCIFIEKFIFLCWKLNASFIYVCVKMMPSWYFVCISVSVYFYMRRKKKILNFFFIRGRVEWDEKYCKWEWERITYCKSSANNRGRELDFVMNRMKKLRVRLFMWGIRYESFVRVWILAYILKVKNMGHLLEKKDDN